MKIVPTHNGVKGSGQATVGLAVQMSSLQLTSMHLVNGLTIEDAILQRTIDFTNSCLTNGTNLVRSMVTFNLSNAHLMLVNCIAVWWVCTTVIMFQTYVRHFDLVHSGLLCELSLAKSQREHMGLHDLSYENIGFKI